MVGPLLYFRMEKDPGNDKYSLLPIQQTSTIHKKSSKNILDIESKPFLRLIHYHYSTFNNSHLLLIVFFPIKKCLVSQILLNLSFHGLF